LDKLIAQLKDYTLLFIENEIGIRENFKEYFELIFKNVYLGIDGVDGYEKYKEYKPDLIITDIKMPNMNGIELVQKIRQEDQETQIIVISAHTDVEYLLSCVPLGLIKYIVKPLNEEKLFHVFNTFVNSHKNNIYVYDKENSQITFDSETHILNYKENMLVDKLVNQNKVISYDEIECDIWDNKEMSPNALRIFIKNLRKKLPEGFIKNITNLGYKLGI